MAEMEYGQQAFSAMRSAQAARGHEDRMNEEGADVASGGAAPDTDKAIKAQEDMLARKMGNEPLPDPKEEPAKAQPEMAELHAIADEDEDSSAGSDGSAHDSGIHP